MHSLQYRPDIDGLRALAILPVVWFHSGLPGIPGGFTGVDTFFVISGFLISSIIHREMEDGSFSFARFYERRLRRIAPALITVSATVLAIGAMLLLPWELTMLAQSAVATIAMVANIFFWREAGYFALGEGITPLLHMWSLGVEEQFYLFFPVALLIAERWRVARSVVITIAALSFALCISGTLRAPSATFYLLPTRAWELMLGALLTVGTVQIPARFCGVAATIGIALLSIAALLITKDSGFPGWIAAVPATGAMLVLGGGPDTFVNRFLARRPFVLIGKLSYSLYLWHWPVFAFMRHYRADVALPVDWAVAGMALSLLLSWVTFRWVEQPARRSSVPYRRVAALGGVGVAGILAVSLAMSAGAGFPQRFDDHVLALAVRRNDLAPLAHACVNTPLDKIDQACRLGAPLEPHWLVWGDSHAAASADGIATGAGEGAIVAAMNTCAPALGWTNPVLTGHDGADCAARNHALLSRVIADPRISTVVLSAYWPSHARHGSTAMWRGVQDLTGRLQAAGKRVVILAGVPEPGNDVPWANAIRSRFGRPMLRWDCPSSLVPVRNVTVIDLSSSFCAHSHPEELFTDNNHPSKTAGMQIIAPAVQRMMQADVRIRGIRSP